MLSNVVENIKSLPETFLFTVKYVYIQFLYIPSEQTNKLQVKLSTLKN